MQIQQGAEVVTAQGEQIGSIHRVVIDPRTREVSHVVVRRGALLAEDKVLPMDWVAGADERRMTLKEGVSALEELPDFEERQFVPLGEDEGDASGFAPAFYWYTPMSGLWGTPTGYNYGLNALPFNIETERNIPPGEVALRDGARVVTADGKDAGSVERILLDAQGEQAMQIVISQGLLFKEQKMVPAAWIDTVSEDEIHLAVDARVLERLPEYRREDD
jgi:uncharacterized protein YrrD